MQPVCKSLTVPLAHSVSIYYTEYVNQVFIVITQLDKFGTIILGEPDKPEDPEIKIYSVQVLFGDSQEEELPALARGLLEALGSSKPVVFSFSLVDRISEIYSDLLKSVEDIKKID